MKAIIEQVEPVATRPLVRLLWFGALWLGGVVSVAVVAYGVRWLLGL